MKVTPVSSALLPEDQEGAVVLIERLLARYKTPAEFEAAVTANRSLYQDELSGLERIMLGYAGKTIGPTLRRISPEAAIEAAHLARPEFGAVIEQTATRRWIIAQLVELRTKLA